VRTVNWSDEIAAGRIVPGAVNARLVREVQEDEQEDERGNPEPIDGRYYLGDGHYRFKYYPED
jgi:hypothetical protein